MGVQNSAQQAIVKSINEFLSFTDIDLGNIDVAHFSYDDEACTKIRDIGIKLEFPEVSEVKNAIQILLPAYERPSLPVDRSQPKNGASVL